ncbi:nucleoside transporter, partial [bacterium]|nr:nucleoside transporter [bacterium]
MERVRGIFCLFVLMVLAWIFSRNRKKINWYVILWGLIFQIIIAIFIFHSGNIGIFRFLNDAVLKIFSFSKEGIKFVFGPLAISPGEGKSYGFILAFQSLPTIIFFSSFVSFLYFIRVMPFIVRIFSFIFTKLMRISGAESLCTSSNIFVGIESALTIRPYLEKMTKSEICTILTAGMATIASSVLGVYVSFLYKEFPQIAGHLISASLMSAPSSIIFSKLLFPEEEKPLTYGKIVKEEYKRPSNWIEAIITGANDGIKLIAGIIAMLIAFLGFVSLLNFLISKFSLFFFKTDMSIQKILSYLFYPFVYLMGISGENVKTVSVLLGERMILTELYSYKQLANLISAGIIK